MNFPNQRQTSLAKKYRRNRSILNLHQRCLKLAGLCAILPGTVMAQNTFPSNGNVGIGTTSPVSALLEIKPSIDGSRQLQLDQQNWYSGFGFTVKDDGSLYIERGSSQIMTMQLNGYVGVGTTIPTAIFEVNGDVKLTANSGASMTFQDGTVQSTAWNGTTLGGDYAEAVDVSGERKTYEPGDVIVIDSDTTGMFGKSKEAYSKLVAGIYSTKPGLVGRRITTGRPNKDAEVPMAMMGIVPTKVSTENGAIKRGDLLVTSSKPGYAMKGTNPSLLTGAVIGKALGTLAEGTGLIEVLVALQ